MRWLFQAGDDSEQGRFSTLCPGPQNDKQLFVIDVEGNVVQDGNALGTFLDELHRNVFGGDFYACSL